MKKATMPAWEKKRTTETRRLEKFLLDQGDFQQVHAYRCNVASIRVRVIDPRFQGKSVDQRGQNRGQISPEPSREYPARHTESSDVYSVRDPRRRKRSAAVILAEPGI